MTKHNLNDKEKELFTKIGDNNIEEVKILLNGGQININATDENGMTLLSMASYKGNYDIVKLLIDNGADVNDHQHIHGYTALMFAGLGGHLEVVNLLLESGANFNMLNSVGRTASQMAALVSQYEVVSMIMNFVSRSDIEYYTKVSGLEKEPRLKSKLVDPLLFFLRQTNINPVRLVMNFEKYHEIIENQKQVINVLKLMCDREMSKLDEPNESLALKYYYLSFVIDYFNKQLDNAREAEHASNVKTLIQKTSQRLIRNLLKGREADGFPVNLECFLRESIKGFPFRDCATFIRLVKTLSTVEIGNEPSALTMLQQTIAGLKGFSDDVPACSTCGEPKPGKVCVQCKKASYCDQICQKHHWFTHKKQCKIAAENKTSSPESAETAAT